jgi:hypothetical protein
VKTLALSLLLALASLGPTAIAHANGAPSFDDGTLLAGMLSGHAVMAGGTFLVLDLVWGLRGRRLPRSLALAQLIVPTTACFLAAATISAYPNSASMSGFFLLSGAYFAVHSILSLAVPLEGDAQRTPQRAPPPRAVVSVAPLLDGAALVARGVF